MSTDRHTRGGMQQSLYRIPCPVCVPVAIIDDGILTATPLE